MKSHGLSDVAGQSVPRDVGHASEATAPVIARMTQAILTIVRLFVDRHLADPASESFGLDVANATGLSAGTTYPILRRLQRAGWLLVREEEVDSHRDTARPPRVYYRINPEQFGTIRQELAERDARQRSKRAQAHGAPAPRGLGTAPTS